MYIQLSHKITYEVKGTDYVFLENKKLINRKTNREILPTYKNGRIGYYIERKFT